MSSGEIDALVDQWRRRMHQQAAVSADDVDEMESHLRDQVGDLVAAGLHDEEAFLIAVKRLGGVDALSQEFAREHSERLWKQLVPTSVGDPGARRRDFWVMLGLGVLAALALRAGVAWLAPETMFGHAALLVLPFLAGYLGWKRRVRPPVVVAGLVTIAVSMVVLDLYPYAPDESPTAILAMVHLPIVLWLLVGLAYTGGQWRSHRRRMDFIRFTGEWLVYYALLALGGGVLFGLTSAAFASLRIDVMEHLVSWVLPCGAGGAVLVAAWLVEAKQDVLENIAPVLTRVFTPLTLLMLVALLVALVAAGNPADVERELLLLMDLVLVLVLGLTLYVWSARDPLAPAGWFDRLQLVVLGTALLVDAMVLVTMLTRIVDAGVTANKVAALGLNLVLLVNLVWSLWRGIGFARARRPFADLERWQTGYLPVYGGWAAFVVVVLPVVFAFG